jgi:NTE family protein
VDADLVLDGGGVKGIALAGAYSVLEQAGYRVHRVAGTSAGAVVGSLIAAGITAERLTEMMRGIDYRRFADEGLLDRLGPLGRGLSVIFEKGIYEGRYFRDWLDGILDGLGKRTFGDLRLDDPALPPDRAYRLVVIASDISRGRLIRLPWDYPDYGLDPDAQPVADAVRASMSIPFFYEPVRLTGRDAGSRDAVSYVVDGGILSNFPVDVFEPPVTGRPPGPTFGIKLSARPESAQMHRFEIDNTLDFARAIAGTLVTWRDQMHIEDPCIADRTIFVDTTGVRATDFDLSAETAQRLYESGRAAAQKFLAGWNFEAYLRRCPPLPPA